MASRSLFRPPLTVGRRSGSCASPAAPSGTGAPFGVDEDQTGAAGHCPDVAREVLHLVAHGRPVERPLMRVRQHGRAVHDFHGLRVEGGFHGDRLPRAIREHPGHAVGQAVDMAAIAGAPTEIRHPPGRALRVVGRAHRTDGAVEELLAALDDRVHRAGRWQRRRLDTADGPVLLRVLARDVDYGELRLRASPSVSLSDNSVIGESGRPQRSR